MKPMLVALAAVVMLVAATSASSHLRAAPPTSATLAKDSCHPRLPPGAPAGEVVVWGHVKSLALKGRRLELRFDPAWWLGGVTANRAAVEDKVIKPGEGVPNDYYIRDEDHRLLTYLVPANAHVTVITNPRLCSTAIPVSELAEIVKGKNPKHRPLFDRHNGLGFWIRIATDTVRSIDQQYQP